MRTSVPDVCVVCGSEIRLWPLSGAQLSNHVKGAGAEVWAGHEILELGLAPGLGMKTGGWGPGGRLTAPLQ